MSKTKVHSPLASKNQKHVPMRTCIVTHKKLPKSELLRFVKTESGEIVVDLKGKQKGRGANIIPEISVFEQAIKKGLLEKALKLGRKLNEEEVADLRTKFTDAIEERQFRPKNKPVSIRVGKEALKKIQKLSH